MKNKICLLKANYTDKNVSVCSEERCWQAWFVMSFLLHCKNKAGCLNKMEKNKDGGCC